VVSLSAAIFLGWQAAPASAAWSDDPTVNLPLSLRDSYQVVSPSSAVSDGAGGAIVFWADDPYSTPEIWAQRVSAMGEILWASDGVPVCTAPGTKSEIRVVGDGAGGAIVVWRDRHGSDYDYYAQRVDGTGAIQWPVGAPSFDGVPVCTVAGDQEAMEAVADGAGGVFVVWRHDDPADDGVYAQRLGPDGARSWPTGAPTDAGVVVCDHDHAQFYPDVALDGAGGVIVAWQDSRNSATTESDVFAQRLSGDGIRQWTTDGVPVCVEDLGQTEPELVGDGSGGAIVIWNDYRPPGSDYGLYAQRLSSTGAIQWPAAGVVLSDTFTSAEADKAIAGDGVGGAYVVWRDRRDVAGTSWDLYAQRLNSLGMKQWIPAGAPVAVADDNQTSIDILSDGTKGVFVSWTDSRTGLPDIYAQHLDDGGLPSGPVNGLAICTNADYQGASTLVSDGGGGIIVAWHDSRNPTTATDIYAHKAFDSLIFRDGFESGATGAWSGVVP
jgi:hypothetical protein